MAQILTNLLVDPQGNYLDPGCPITVSSDGACCSPGATVFKGVKIATDFFDAVICNTAGQVQRNLKYGSVVPGEEVEASHPVAKVDGLRIIDDMRGNIVIAETAQSYADKVNRCCGVAAVV